MNNITLDHFPVNPGWALDGILWLVSFLLGAPANLVVLLFGRYASSLGNFRFAINIISIVNVLHCCSRGIVTILYFYHYLLSIETSLIPATISANVGYRWLGYYIVFYIPSLSAYRFVLFCVTGGEYYLTKRNLSIATALLAIIPTAIVIGQLDALIQTDTIDPDPVFSYRYSNRECSWCSYISTYSPYICYFLTITFTFFLCVHVYRSFRLLSHSGRDTNLSHRRGREEVGILVCIIIHSLIPVLITIPLKLTQIPLIHRLGRRWGMVGNVLYNFNPLFDAILIVLCVKPYRQAFKKVICPYANCAKRSKIYPAPIRQ